MSFRVTIDGAERIGRELEGYPRKARKLLDGAADRSAEVLRDRTKKLPPVSKERTGFAAKGIPVAPVHGGTLRQSVQKRKLRDLAAGVYTGAHYGGYVHQGTAKMPARPFFEWALEAGAEKEIDAIFDDVLSRLP